MTEMGRSVTEMSDLIRREDAIKAIAEVLSLNRFSSFKDIKNFDRFAERMLRNVPSADRPQGEWIDAEIPLESGGSMPIQVCNLCKTFYPLAYTGGGHRFCPNCGARMKGANNEKR